VVYGENANTNLTVKSLYGFDSSNAIVLSNNEQPFEFNINYNNNSYQSNGLSNNKDPISISFNSLDAQINIDLNEVLVKSQLSLERLNSCVSRMSLDEDAGLSVEDERDLQMLLMLDEQSTFETGW
jgi:hypothetical protein